MQDDIPGVVAQAREKAQNNDLAGAAKLATEALERAPADPAARLAMVFVRYLEKRTKPLENAIRSAFEVVADPIERARCHVYMASLYTNYSIGSDDIGVHAIAHARRAIELAPSDADGHFALALALEKRHRYTAAVDAIDVACSLEADPEHLSEQTRLRDRVADFPRRLAEARATVETAPTSDNLTTLGSLAAYSDQLDEAVAAFERAAKLDTKHEGVKALLKKWRGERTPKPVMLKTDPKPPARKPAKKAAAKKSANKPARKPAKTAAKKPVKKPANKQPANKKPANKKPAKKRR